MIINYVPFGGKFLNVRSNVLVVRVSHSQPGGRVRNLFFCKDSLDQKKFFGFFLNTFLNLRLLIFFSFHLSLSFFIPDIFPTNLFCFDDLLPKRGSRCSICFFFGTYSKTSVFLALTWGANMGRYWLVRFCGI